MDSARLERSIALIGKLIAFPTVSRDSNRDLLVFVAETLGHAGVASEIIWNEERTKGNLWATIDPTDRKGVILSGHSDVVPVDGQEWTSDPFALRREGERLYGRGACDMKGFLGVVLAAVPTSARASLRAPIHLAVSYDEEVGCTGVRSLIARLAEIPTRPVLCLVGEPTSMQPVIGQKGGGLYRVALRGHSAHSSLAPQAINAVEFAADVVRLITSIGDWLKESHVVDEEFDVPYSTMSVTRIDGGTALNIIPGDCELNFDLRALPELDATQVIAKLKDAIESETLPRMRARHPDCGIELETLVELLPLATDPNHPAVTLVKRLTGRNDHSKVSYGTEAGLFSQRAGITLIVCGPGSIAQAHKPDEYLEIEEVRKCSAFLDRLTRHLELQELDW